VLVEEAYRRQGIGSAAYRFVEVLSGRTMKNFWGSDPYQTEAAKTFWANPNRPFGRRPDC
jgi:hypothetical protein